MTMQAGRSVGGVRPLREPSNHPERRGIRVVIACLALLLVVAAVSSLFLVLEKAPWERFAEAQRLVPPREDFRELFTHRRL